MPLVLETVQAQFSDMVARARVVLRHVPMVLETVQVQFTAPVAEPTVVSFTVPLFLYYRCHCNWRDLVLFVGRLLWLCGPFLLRECLRRDVVWWWFYSWWCLRLFGTV